MSDPFIAEIRFFTYTFIPQGWLACDGTTYQVAQYPALYSLIGTTYGGTLGKTFRVPDLRSMAPMGVNPSAAHSQFVSALGHSYGYATTSLTESNLPPHTHQLSRHKPQTGYTEQTSVASATSDLGGLASSTTVNNNIFTKDHPVNTTLDPSTVAIYGGSTEHANCQPYLPLMPAINYDGIYPDFG